MPATCTAHEPDTMEATSSRPACIRTGPGPAAPTSTWICTLDRRQKTRLTGGCCCRGRRPQRASRGWNSRDLPLEADAVSAALRPAELPPEGVYPIAKTGAAAHNPSGRGRRSWWTGTEPPLQLALSGSHRARDPLPHADGWYQHHRVAMPGSRPSPIWGVQDRPRPDHWQQSCCDARLRTDDGRRQSRTQSLDR